MTFEFRIRNFASFDDSGWVSISPGVQALIGINNIGKTAVLWALDALSFVRSTRPDSYHPRQQLLGYARPNGPAVIDIRVPVTPEMHDNLQGPFFGVGDVPFTAGRKLRFEARIIDQSIGLCNMFVSDTASEKERTIFHNKHGNFLNWYDERELPGDTTTDAVGLQHIAGLGDDTLYSVDGSGSVGSLWPSFLAESLIMYAHRNPLAKRRLVHSMQLQPDASNLADVLATAQLSSAKHPDSRDQFDWILSMMRRLFPEIRNVRTESSAPQNDPGQNEVEIRFDLRHGSSIPLSHSGTGVQQTLCLLTAAVFAQRPTLVLIDEPHSYLHPAAERGLLIAMEQLARDRGHYFCIATQSPVIASFARHALLAVTRPTGEGARISRLSRTSDALDHLGIQNADIFTYDKLLFVEGDSDKHCIEAALECSEIDLRSQRYKVVVLRGDGDFKSRKIRISLLRLLLQANTSEASVKLVFLFDSNDWSETEKRDLLHLATRSAAFHFLSKPEIEDYILDPAAIAHAVNETLTVQGSEPGACAQDVERKLKTLNGKGSKILKEIFNNYSVDFQKEKHGRLIAQHMQENNPGAFKDLIEELKAAFDV